MGARYLPWRELWEREHLELVLDRLPAVAGGALYWPLGRRRALVAIDRQLGPRERADALTHELVHDERGGLDMSGLPAWGADRVEALEETLVWHQVARRRVPLDDLAVWVERVVADGQAVTAELVAEEFDVWVGVAALGLARLRTAGPGRWPRPTPIQGAGIALPSSSSQQGSGAGSGRTWID